MPRSRREPITETLPEMIEALDLVRLTLLAADVTALAAEQRDNGIEELRASRLGDDRQLAATRARGRLLAAAADGTRNELSLSRLEVPAPVEHSAVLHGRVLIEGSAAAKVSVVALDDQDRPLAEAVTDDQGHYVLEIPGKEAARVRLEIRKGTKVLPTEKGTTRIEPGRVGFQEVVVGRG